MALKKSDTKTPETAPENEGVQIDPTALTPAEGETTETTPPADETPAAPAVSAEDEPESTETAVPDEDPAPTPEVQIPDPESEPPASEGVHIDTASLTPDVGNIPQPKEQNVRVRLRVNHRCCIAMERYDFKAGQTYVVPPNVKRILSERGLLSAL